MDKANIYLFFGEEKYLLKQEEKKLLESFLPTGSETMNLMAFDRFASKNTENIIDSCNTMPFMSSYRVVSVKDSGLFDRGRKADSERMAEYIKELPETTVLYFNEENVDKRGALYKAVNKLGVCREFSVLKDNELTDEVIELSEGRLDRQNAEFLIKCVGNRLESLEGEINKLLQFVEEGEKITASHIESICTIIPESKIFDMVAAIGSRNPEKALDIYNNLLEAKESPFGILKMISRQFRLILQCKYLARKNMDREDIAQETGLRGFMVRDYLRQGKNFTNKTLMQALRDCFNCDINIKKGLVGDRLGVEMIILKYSKN